MAEVPHCPYCGRADTVDSRAGPEYEYYCQIPGCQSLFEPDDVTEIAWIDMVSNSMFDDPDSVKENASRDVYSDECECQFCERGRPFDFLDS